MTSVEKRKILDLIYQYCTPDKRCYYWSSYALKEVFEKLADCYISNEDFKALMQKAGFRPMASSRNEPNHRYRLRVKTCEEISIYYWGNGAESYKYKKVYG